ncbi:hypothetical protein [Caldimonas sp. KR1-144]|uniref:hypothetical protein n=1 Tax=Caldimonas sp. KR1-144 TaxID=3400911 RepID=UPI003BFFAC7E
MSPTLSTSRALVTTRTIKLPRSSPAPEGSFLHEVPLPEAEEVPGLPRGEVAMSRFPAWLLDTLAAKLATLDHEPYTVLNKMVDMVMEHHGFTDRAEAERAWLHDIGPQVRQLARQYWQASQR